MAKLYPFQVKGVDFLEREGRALLADAPRLGKAVQSLNAAQGRTLVVAPSMVLEAGGWQKDAAIWRPDLDITFVSYALLNDRETVRRADGRAISKVLERLRPEWKGHYDTLILDESHHIKERKTKWTIAALKIDAENCFLLSGTPIPNWAHELFTTLQAISPGDRRFTSYWRWVQEWFATEKNPFNMAAIEVGGLKPGRTWQDFMQSNLGTAYLRRTWSEAGIQMPPFQREVFWVKMTPKQDAAYKSMRKKFIVDFGHSQVQAWTTGAQTIRLAQLTTGIDLLETGEKGSGKLDLVKELLDDYAGEPVVLFCHFRATARILRDICDKKGLSCGIVWGGDPKRAGILGRFQSGELDVLIGTIDTVSESLEMWRANLCIFVERVWRPTMNEQAMDRLAFIGKTTPIRVLDLITKDSADQSMYYQLQTKTDQQMKAMTAAQLAKLL